MGLAKAESASAGKEVDSAEAIDAGIASEGLNEV